MRGRRFAGPRPSSRGRARRRPWRRLLRCGRSAGDGQHRRDADRACPQAREFRRDEFLPARFPGAAVTEEARLRDGICRLGASIFARGLTSGSSGNISARLADGWLMTPTNVSLGRLDPARLSKVADDGSLVGGDAPTKESFLPRVMYEEREKTGAVIHLHSTHSVAVSCLADIDPADAMPPIPAYYVMRVGRLPLVPYFRPGDLALAEAVRGFACTHHAVLLANHGPVVAGSNLDAAVNAIEELEETAKLYLLLRGAETRYLTRSQVMELQG